MGVYPDVHLSKTAADAETAAVHQEIVVGLGTPGDDRKPAENGDMDVGIEAGDQFPVGQVKPGGFEGVLQFEEGISASDLHGVRGRPARRENGFADLGAGGFRTTGRVPLATSRVIFDVVSGDAERVRREKLGG